MNVKLRLLVLTSVMGLVASGFAQTNAPAASGAKIVFDSKDFNFGQVDSGELVKHEFIFTNTGDQVLEITGVRTSCGCTTTGESDKKVEPGKTGKIPVQFNSRGYGGGVHKQIFVTCNDSNQPNVTLNLQGTIWKQIDTIPQYAVFNMPPDGQKNMTQTIRIVNNGDEPVTISDPSCGNHAFQCELKTVKEGKEYELQVTAVSSNITGNSSAPITLKTSLDKMPQVSVTAFVIVAPLLVVNPSQINLPEGPLAHEMKFSVMIQNNSTNSMTLSDPEVNAKNAEIKVAEQVPGRVFNLILSFPAGFECTSNFQATVKTTSSKNPLITIPVKQPAPPAAASAPSHTNQQTSVPAKPMSAAAIPVASK